MYLIKNQAQQLKELLCRGSTRVAFFQDKVTMTQKQVVVYQQKVADAQRKPLVFQQ